MATEIKKEIQTRRDVQLASVDPNELSVGEDRSVLPAHDDSFSTNYIGDGIYRNDEGQMRRVLGGAKFRYEPWEEHSIVRGKGYNVQVVDELVTFIVRIRKLPMAGDPKSHLSICRPRYTNDKPCNQIYVTCEAGEGFYVHQRFELLLTKPRVNDYASLTLNADLHKDGCAFKEVFKEGAVFQVTGRLVLRRPTLEKLNAHIGSSLSPVSNITTATLIVVLDDPEHSIILSPNDNLFDMVPEGYGGNLVPELNEALGEMITAGLPKAKREALAKAKAIAEANRARAAVDVDGRKVVNRVETVSSVCDVAEEDDDGIPDFGNTDETKQRE